ncbi:hypothetical protein BKG69_05055 [Mycobacteroides chelonae]|nr:hypothetical protein BKG69_05055 [Mycobacteroides chelonae]GLE56217.1 hypothetical protein NJBCHELONAE_15250 [Mycobacteroides chelonae]
MHRRIDEADNDWGFAVIRHDFRHDPSTPSEKTGNDPEVGGVADNLAPIHSPDNPYRMNDF